jgi:hypothetical protein
MWVTTPNTADTFGNFQILAMATLVAIGWGLASAGGHHGGGGGGGGHAHSFAHFHGPVVGPDTKIVVSGGGHGGGGHGGGGHGGGGDHVDYVVQSIFKRL